MSESGYYWLLLTAECLKERIHIHPIHQKLILSLVYQCHLSDINIFSRGLFKRVQQRLSIAVWLTLWPQQEDHWPGVYFSSFSVQSFHCLCECEWLFVCDGLVNWPTVTCELMGLALGSVEQGEQMNEWMSDTRTGVPNHRDTGQDQSVDHFFIGHQKKKWRCYIYFIFFSLQVILIWKIATSSQVSWWNYIGG